jgi:membrane fusion protein (multidrug efflux system)
MFADRPSPKQRRRARWVALLALLAVVLVLGGIKALQIRAMMKAGATFAPPPETVSTAVAETMSWQSTQDAVGTVVATRAVVLSAEIPGRVVAVYFDSGQSVKKGAPLVRLDAATERAQLTSAEAQEVLAQQSLARAKELRAAGANTEAELDQVEAQAKQASAAVAALRATLAKKVIAAPFDGRVAIRQVELGQIISAGTPVASLQSVSPIYAEFSLPQQSIANVRVGDAVRMWTDIFAKQDWTGKVSVVNPEVDLATRNVRYRATFENPDGRLTPGMFTQVEVVFPEKREVLVVPSTAVIFAPYGDSVYVVEEKKDPKGKSALIAQQRFVRLGERKGDFVAIAEGLKKGEQVVSSGAFKLRNGTPVQVNNALAPSAKLNPKPPEP